MNEFNKFEDNKYYYIRVNDYECILFVQYFKEIKQLVFQDVSIKDENKRFDDVNQTCWELDYIDDCTILNSWDSYEEMMKDMFTKLL